MIAMQGVTLFSVIILAIWTVPAKLKFSAHHLSHAFAGVPGIWYSWYPDLMPHDQEMKGFMIAVSNMFSYINSIWWSDAVWRTAESPRFRPGFIGAAAMGIGMILAAG